MVVRLGRNAINELLDQILIIMILFVPEKELSIDDFLPTKWLSSIAKSHILYIFLFFLPFPFFFFSLFSPFPFSVFLLYFLASSSFDPFFFLFYIRRPLLDTVLSHVVPSHPCPLMLLLNQVKTSSSLSSHWATLSKVGYITVSTET